MTDVGGQRSERRKWLHLFHGVDVVVYVADISSYDVVDEEYQSNALMTSLSVFTSLSKREWLKETRLILVLNKIDLFKEKIAKVPLSECFPYYTGGDNQEDAEGFIKGKFTETSMSQERKNCIVM